MGTLSPPNKAYAKAAAPHALRLERPEGVSPPPNQTDYKTTTSARHRAEVLGPLSSVKSKDRQAPRRYGG